MSKLNFDEFSSFSEQLWEQLATKELKGKPLESIDFSTEGFRLKPVAFQAPRTLNLRKPSTGVGNQWVIRQNLSSSMPENTINSILSGGVDSVGFDPIEASESLWKALQDHSHVRLVVITDDPIKAEQAVCDQLGSEGVERIDAIEFDCWGFDGSNDKGFAFNLPALSIPNYSINTADLRDMGSSIEDELVFGLSAGHHALVRLLDHGLSIDDASVLIHFQTGIGADYLAEIAKLRVLRNLWGRIVSEYEPEHSCSVNTRITARASLWNLGDRDYNTNLIRLTNCALGSVVGGADEIIANPHDGAESEKSMRLSRNIQLLLKHESWMSHVNDPAAGSYFLENLSAEIADQVWGRFCEEESGFENDFNTGSVHEKIAASAMNDAESVGQGDKIMIGMNKFQNPAAEAEAGSWLNAGNAIEKEVES